MLNGEQGDDMGTRVLAGRGRGERHRTRLAGWARAVTLAARRPGRDRRLSGTASRYHRACDIYAAASTPCVAAHSTTRALYGAYSGSLYQVKRASDSTR